MAAEGITTGEGNEFIPPRARSRGPPGRGPGGPSGQPLDEARHEMSDLEKLDSLQKQVRKERLEYAEKIKRREEEIFRLRQEVETLKAARGSPPVEDGDSISASMVEKMMAAAVTAAVSGGSSITRKDGSSTTKSKLVYLEDDFADPDALERRFIHPNAIITSLKKSRIVPLSLMTAIVYKEYETDSAGVVVPSVSIMLPGDDKYTTVVDTESEGGIAPSKDLTMSKEQWLQGWARLLDAMETVADQPNIESLTYLRDFFMRHRYFDLKFPVIARCCLKLRKLYFQRRINFSDYNIERDLGIANEEQIESDMFARHAIKLASMEARFSGSPLRATSSVGSYSGRRFDPVLPSSAGNRTSRSQAAGNPSSGDRDHRAQPQPFQSNSGRGGSTNRCYICASPSHQAQQCTATVRKNGERILARWEGNFIVRVKDRKPYCYHFSGGRPCNKLGCEAIHECSTCGSADHGARKC